MHQDLLQLQTCQTFSITKNRSPKIVTFWNHLNWLPQGTLIRNCPFLGNTFEPYRSFEQPLNQKPTLSKRSSYEKRCFKLEGHLRHVTLPRVDHKKNEWIREKEKLIVMSCTWKIRLSLNENQENQIQKNFEKNEILQSFSPAKNCSSV